MTVSASQLIDRLTQSGIVSADVALRLAGQSGQADGNSLAQQVVQAGLATSFQCESLLADKPRALLLGDYLLLDELGAGGMGVVFKARHRRMDRTVALKVLARELTTSAEAVQRFYREVKAAARLQHQNIVMAFDASEQDGEHYLVMEFVEGRDLDGLVREKGALSIGEALHHVVDAAEGLAYAHANGIVHRDIKPANLLLATDGVVKLLDLGVARLRDAEMGGAEPTLTQTGFMVGTIAYMAPEHAEDPRAADERSDVYSLGCTLYRILTGNLPYTGNSAVQLLLAAREKPIPDLRAYFPPVPGAAEFLDGLQSVFEQLVAKRPEDRYQSMERVASAVRALLANLPKDVAAWRARPPEQVAAAAAESGSAASFLDSAGRSGAVSGEATTLLESDAEVARSLPPLASGAAGTASASAVTPRPARPSPHRTGAGRPAPPPTRVAAPPARTPWLAIVGAILAVAAVTVIGTVLVLRPDRSPAVPPRAAATPEVVREVRATATPTPAPAADPPAGAGADARPDEPSVAEPPRLGGATDLLAVAEAGRRRSPLGSWEVADGRLVSQGTGPASITLPFVPPEAFRVVAVLRQAETDVPAAVRSTASSRDPLERVTAGLTLHLGTRDGEELVVQIDRPHGEDQHASRVTTPRELDARVAPSDVTSRAVLQPDAWHALDVHVHPHEIVVLADGQFLVRQSRMPRGPTRSPLERTHGTLGLVSAGPLVVRRWELGELRLGGPGAGAVSFVAGGAPVDEEAASQLENDLSRWREEAAARGASGEPPEGATTPPSPGGHPPPAGHPPPPRGGRP